MKRTTCPYLGLKDDPTTTLDFPSPGNYCHQARPIAPVRGTYQEKYCLKENHTACPLYQAPHPIPLPAAVKATTSPTRNGRQFLPLAGIPALLFVFAIFLYAWNNYGSQLLQIRSIPNTGPITTDLSFGLLGARPLSTITPLSLVNATDTPQAPKKNCPQPKNWVMYIVNPTDSLYRLSVIYGVRVEDLQQANCMGDKTVILPGQVIYIPFIPTNTPVEIIKPAPAILPTHTNTSPPPPPKPTKTPRPTVLPSPTNTVQPAVQGTITTGTPTVQTTTIGGTPTPQPTTNASNPTITISPKNSITPTITVQPTPIPGQSTSVPSPQPSPTPLLTLPLIATLPPLPTVIFFP